MRWISLFAGSGIGFAHSPSLANAYESSHRSLTSHAHMLSAPTLFCVGLRKCCDGCTATECSGLAYYLLVQRPVNVREIGLIWCVRRDLRITMSIGRFCVRRQAFGGFQCITITTQRERHPCQPQHAKWKVQANSYDFLSQLFHFLAAFPISIASPLHTCRRNTCLSIRSAAFGFATPKRFTDNSSTLLRLS